MYKEEVDGEDGKFALHEAVQLPQRVLKLRAKADTWNEQTRVGALADVKPLRLQGGERGVGSGARLSIHLPLWRKTYLCEEDYGDEGGGEGPGAVAGQGGRRGRHRRGRHRRGRRRGRRASSARASVRRVVGAGVGAGEIVGAGVGAQPPATCLTPHDVDAHKES